MLTFTEMAADDGDGDIKDHGHFREQALKDWDEKGIVPDGWKADPQGIIKNWQGFADQVRVHVYCEVILSVTSNGIARFAPYITGDFEGFRQNHKIKISTGALCVLRYEGERWVVKDWNLKPG
mgnify:CR=1 FL=1